MREQVNHLSGSAANKAVLPEKIALTTAEGLIFVKTADNVRCESNRMYIVVFLKCSEKIMVSKPVGQTAPR